MNSTSALEGGVTVSFAERFSRSEQFDQLFREGMALVEETANFLDGRGRKEAKGLKPPVSVVYATESMRLTTRLLECASWLVVQRALKEGEITVREADERRARVKLRTLGRPGHIKHFEALPEGLKDLISRSFALTDRITQIDTAMSKRGPDGVAAATGPNPVAQQLARLTAAFGVGTRH